MTNLRLSASTATAFKRLTKINLDDEVVLDARGRRIMRDDHVVFGSRVGAIFLLSEGIIQNAFHAQDGGIRLEVWVTRRGYTKLPDGERPIILLSNLQNVATI
jgi:hypothetical protein